MTNKQLFAFFLDEVKEWQIKTEAAYKVYRKERKHIVETYKEEIAAKKLSDLRDDIRNELFAADTLMHHTAEQTADSLMSNLESALDPAGAQQQIAALRAFYDFKVKLSAFELRTLAKSCTSYLALRALSSVAKESGFEMAVPTLDGFVDEIKRFRAGFVPPMCYAVSDYLPEFKEIYPEIPFRRDDGTIYHWGAGHNDTWAVTQAQVMKHMPEKLEEMAARWNNTFIPDIVPIDSETATGEDVKNQAEATQAAKETAAARAEGLKIQPAKKEAPQSETAAATLARYTT